jgi:hypothetical protein
MEQRLAPWVLVVPERDIPAPPPPLVPYVVCPVCNVVHANPQSRMECKPTRDRL